MNGRAGTQGPGGHTSEKDPLIFRAPHQPYVGQLWYFPLRVTDSILPLHYTNSVVKGNSVSRENVPGLESCRSNEWALSSDLNSLVVRLSRLYKLSKLRFHCLQNGENKTLVADTGFVCEN